MAVVFKTGNAQQIPVTDAAMYTNASGETSFIKSILLHNTDTVARIVTIYMVPNSGGSAGTAGATNQLEKLTMNGSETIHIALPSGGFVFSGTNDTVKAECDSASKVNLWITARVDT